MHALLVVTVLVVALPLHAAAGATSTVTGTTMEDALLQRINGDTCGRGYLKLRPLVWSTQLADMAQQWSDTMAAANSGVSHSSVQPGGLRQPRALTYFPTPAPWPTPFVAAMTTPLSPGESVSMTQVLRTPPASGVAIDLLDDAAFAQRLAQATLFRWMDNESPGFQCVSNTGRSGAGHYLDFIEATTWLIGCGTAARDVGASINGARRYNVWTTCIFWPPSKLNARHPFLGGGWGGVDFGFDSRPANKLSACPSNTLATCPELTCCMQNDPVPGSGVVTSTTGTSGATATTGTTGAAATTGTTGAAATTGTTGAAATTGTTGAAATTGTTGAAATTTGTTGASATTTGTTGAAATTTGTTGAAATTTGTTGAAATTTGTTGAAATTTGTTGAAAATTGTTGIVVVSSTTGTTGAFAPVDRFPFRKVLARLVMFLSEASNTIDVADLLTRLLLFFPLDQRNQVMQTVSVDELAGGGVGRRRDVEQTSGGSDDTTVPLTSVTFDAPSTTTAAVEALERTGALELQGAGIPATRPVALASGDPANNDFIAQKAVDDEALGNVPTPAPKKGLSETVIIVVVVCVAAVVLLVIIVAAVLRNRQMKARSRMFSNMDSDFNSSAPHHGGEF